MRDVVKRAWVVGFGIGLLFLAGCYDPPVPVVTAVSPANGATNVSVHAVVSVSFSEEMDERSLGGGNFGLVKASDEAPVSGRISYVDKTATFVPAARLEPNTVYRIRLSSEIRSGEEVALGETPSYSFTTQLGADAGAVTFVEPSDFVLGRATVTLPNVSAVESVMVIPVHATQDLTRGFSTDGFDYTITASGLLAGGGSLGKPAQKSTTVERFHKLRRHPKGFRKHWEALKKLSKNDKESANAYRQAAQQAGTFGKCRGPYSVGMQCTFKVIDYNDAFVDVPTTLRHVGTNAYFFIDNNDLGDFSATELSQLALSLDQVAVPVNKKYFGDFPDSDGNAKVIVVLSRVLIDPTNKTGAFGYVAPWDLYADGTVSEPSNEGDIFYAATPARVQLLGYTRSEYFEEVMPETIVHELKHLVAVGARLLNNRDAEDLWLEEPSAVAAEELAGFGSLRGGTQSMASYALANPQNYRVHWDGRPSDSDEEYSMYGYNFLFLWRVAEQRGHEQFWKPWVVGPGTGKANLEAHTGVSFRSLMTDWAVTLAFDHGGALAGYDYEAINLRDGSWDTLGVKALASTISGSVRSAAYYVGSGQGANVTIRLESRFLNPYFVVVRYPRL